MRTDGLAPNLRTFGCLALACDSQERGENLLRDLDVSIYCLFQVFHDTLFLFKEVMIGPLALVLNLWFMC